MGGSAANCSHAVNDFRKLCGIDTLTPLDNVAELTANINDEGWENSILNYLKISKMNKNDILFILSVGGNFKKNVSVNLIKSIQFANKNKTKVVGICGKESGYLQKKNDVVLIVPNINNSLVTPYSESFQSIILHSLVSDPRLQIKILNGKKCWGTFFDRDGVLTRGINKNRKLYAVLKTKDLKFLPGAIQFLKKYKRKFKIIVITNQPDIAKGKISNETINEMNQKMMRLNLIDEILICPHSKNQKCSCRKPKIGLIKLAKKI